MDMDSKAGRGGKMATHNPQSAIHLVILSSCLLVFLLTGCTNIRPIAKIGLIAPFEGLHRRSGYEALAAMRLAIADAGVVGIDFIPLALDDSSNPQRTAQKMRADPSLRAIIGPLTPLAMNQVTSLFSATNASQEIPWLVPFVVSPAGGFADPRHDQSWALGLIQAVADSVRSQGGAQLVIAGLTAGWPGLSAAEWSAKLGIKITLTDEPSAVPSGATVFWLGGADTGASFINELQMLDSTAEVWLGPAGGDPVFSELAQLRKPVNWATWSQSEYNDNALTHPTLTLTSYLVYRATLQAIAQVAAQSGSQENTKSLFEYSGAKGISSGAGAPWSVRCYQIMPDRTLVALDQCHPR